MPGGLVVLLEADADVGAAVRVAERLSEKLGAPFRRRDGAFVARASAGIALNAPKPWRPRRGKGGYGALLESARGNLDDAILDVKEARG